MSNTKHKYADILIAIANGEQIQSETISSGWFDVRNSSVLISIADEEHSNFRIKPKTININGFEVPEPLTTSVKTLNHQYYTPCIHSAHKYQSHYWCNDDFDKRMIDSGVVHLTFEAAKLHAEALLSFTKGKA